LGAAGGCVAVADIAAVETIGREAIAERAIERHLGGDVRSQRGVEAQRPLPLVVIASAQADECLGIERGQL
jgi:hypothetical protein